MAAEIGLDPTKDIHWVTRAESGTDPLELFVQGQIDAFLGFPPEPQELRARHACHVILNTTTDRPWSHYFCSMLASNRDYVRKHPVATKRVLRTVLKAADLCASDPARVARRISFDKWREYDPEDTMRFAALRLHEAGLIKSSPQKIIAEGTDWRFFKQTQTRAEGITPKWEMVPHNTSPGVLEPRFEPGTGALFRPADI